MKKYFLIFLLFFSAKAFSQVPATSGYLLTKSNGAISIGTEVNTAPVTVANFSTSFVTPQAGTILHLVSDAVTNGRASFDTYNNTSIAGSNYQGRRARGTASSPLPPNADDVLVAIGADGYGVDSFTNISVGSMNIRANATFTNTSKPTYVSFTTTPSGSITQAERLRIKPDGQIQLFGYGSGTFTGTPTKVLQVDANGNIIEGNIGGSASWGSITGTLSSQTDLQTALDAKLATNGNGSSLTGLTATQVGLGNVTNESKATMFTNPTLTGEVSLPAATTTTSPANVPSGTLETTPEAGDVLEYDGNAIYATTDAGNRGVISVDNLIRLDAAYALTNSVAEQKIFNTTANGRLTLETGTYFFESVISVSGMSATSGNAAFDLLGAGGATIGTVLYHVTGVDGNANTAATQTGSTSTNAQTPASMVTAGTGTALQASIRGTFEITVAGTIVPSITLVTASAATVAAGSYFRVRRIGSTSAGTVGQWD